MPIFRGRLVFNKETEEKHRWITSVHGVQFKIYITQKRVPEPVPMEIEASVFDSSFSTVVRLIGLVERLFANCLIETERNSKRLA